ncbi:type VII secretion-associated serine protease mycosin [Streptomyces sp. NPDC052236]|uniref:type VII secretion-associated serine protease mycosin n=1 Tax=Streptomyces sp. NPDC052236 TaxID=3365686 RepID=UPI0037D86DA6
MHPSSNRIARYNKVVSGAAGLLLVVIAATPAHAETIRSLQWHLDVMRAEEMWKTSTGKGVTVAVVDTGVGSVPELAGQVLPGKDFTDAAGDERDDIGKHGTGMASLIAGTGAGPGGDGAFGLAPGAKILPLRTLGGSAAGGKAINEAIRYAADSDAKVISISLGSPARDQETTEAVKYALGKGKLIFAAVGNSGPGSLVEYPAAAPGVVGVAAVDKKINGTEESQRGPEVDLAAPGEDIVTGCTGKTGYCKGHGTSDSTALVSASAALIWSQHPDWTNNQVLRVMLNTAGGPTSGAKRNDVIGYGMVRPRIALKTPGDPGPADEYPLPDLAAAAPKSPSPEVSKPTGSTEKDEKPAAAAPKSDDDSSPGLWIALGVGAAALLGAAVAIPVVRSRRRNAAAPSAPVFSPNAYQQQPQYPAYGPPPTGQSPNTAYPPGPPGPGQP